MKGHGFSPKVSGLNALAAAQALQHLNLLGHFFILGPRHYSLRKAIAALPPQMVCQVGPVLSAMPGCVCLRVLGEMDHRTRLQPLVQLSFVTSSDSNLSATLQGAASKNGNEVCRGPRFAGRGGLSYLLKKPVQHGKVANKIGALHQIQEAGGHPPIAPAGTQSPPQRLPQLNSCPMAGDGKEAVVGATMDLLLRKNLGLSTRSPCSKHLLGVGFLDQGRARKSSSSTHP